MPRDDKTLNAPCDEKEEALRRVNKVVKMYVPILSSPVINMFFVRMHLLLRPQSVQRSRHGERKSRSGDVMEGRQWQGEDADAQALQARSWGGPVMERWRRA